MKNKQGFANRKGFPEPTYRNIAGGWCAIYTSPIGEEIHLQMNPCRRSYGEKGRDLSVLIQKPDHRQEIGTHSTIKAGLEQVRNFLKEGDKHV